MEEGIPGWEGCGFMAGWCGVNLTTVVKGGGEKQKREYGRDKAGLDEWEKQFGLSRLGDFVGVGVGLLPCCADSGTGLALNGEGHTTL